MPDLWMDVDTALSEVPVNILPLCDDTDFKSIEGAVAYDAAGMALRWHFVTPAGAYTVTSVTPTTGGNYDWTDQGDSGIYTIEIPASGGASINNDTEGFGWFTGVATGVLPWRGPIIGFRAAGLNDAMVESAWSTTRGLAGTALPAAAADAAGGLPISDAGGLDIDTLLGRITGNVALASVLGALNDAAVDGDPTTTDTVMQYVKQVVNTLCGTAGIPTFPASAAPGNGVSLAEMLRAIYDDSNELQGDWVNGGRLDLLIDAILADTNELQTDWVNGGRLDLLIDSIISKVDTIDDFLDTEIADILTDTGTTLDDFIDTEVAAIKAKTDSLTFTVAGVVDANIQRVNDVALVGDGAATPWGP